MGTSTAWRGPSQTWATPAAAAARAAAQWQPEHEDSGEFPSQVIDDLLANLHRDMRENPVAAQLRHDTYAAGNRLAQLMTDLSRERPDSADRFIQDVTRSIGGDGGTLAAAVIRRAASEAAQHVLDEHPEAFLTPASAAGHGLASDVLCDLFRFFFAEIAAQYLRSVIAAHVEASMPVLLVVDPDSRIAEWVSRKLMDKIVDPCDHAAGLAGDTAPPLAKIAHKLVPMAVRSVLGHEDDNTTTEPGADQ